MFRASFQLIVELDGFSDRNDVLSSWVLSFYRIECVLFVLGEGLYSFCSSFVFLRLADGGKRCWLRHSLQVVARLAE